MAPAETSHVMKTIVVVLPVLAVLFAGCIKTDKERALANGAKPLTKQEAREQFTGNTAVGTITQYGLNYVVYYDADGRITGTLSGGVSDNARGTWRINDRGQVCNEWSKASWRNGPACNTYYKEGDAYKVFLDEGGVASIGRIEKGNSKKLEMRTDMEVARIGGTLEQLSVESLRSVIPGNTVSGELNALDNTEYYAFYTDDGEVSARIPSADEEDSGTYRITDEGEVCVKWARWLDQKENCGHWYRDGKKIKIFDDGGSLALTAEIRDGDPEKLGR